MATNITDNTNTENQKTLQPDVYKYVGTCESTGQNLSAFVSNASFEQLARLDYNIRKENTTNTEALLVEYGLGSNIANSLIVSAPTKTEDAVQDRTSTKTIRYYDLDKSSSYNDGDYVISEKSTDELTNSETSSTITRDTGWYDLSVTDSTGRIACITPPFNDFDTRYFDSVFSNTYLNGNTTTYGEIGSYRNAKPYSDAGIGITRMLTLNSSTSKSIDNMNTFIENAGTTYLSILNEYEKDIALTNTEENQIYVGKCYYTNGNSTTYLWASWIGGEAKKPEIIKSPTDESKKETIEGWVPNTIFVSSFSTILDKYCNLKNDVDNILNGSFPENSGFKKIIKNFEDRIKTLENYKYVFRLGDSQGTYLWSGTYSNYNGLSDTIKNEDSNMFIISRG